MSARFVGDQPCVCFMCGTRNYVGKLHCRGCGYKLIAGAGVYRDLSAITTQQSRSVPKN